MTTPRLTAYLDQLKAAIAQKDGDAAAAVIKAMRRIDPVVAQQILDTLIDSGTRRMLGM